MIASPNSFEPQSTEPLPGSRRVYVSGRTHPFIRVGMREVQLGAARSPNGHNDDNAPVRLYDCSGPWGDPDFRGSVDRGLPALRREWILARGDVEESRQACQSNAGHGSVSIPRSLDRSPLRAKPDRAVTQLHYARKGIITPEMEFIAIRENLGREQAERNTKPLRAA